MMTTSTLNFIHKSYNEAVMKSETLIEVIEHLYELLEVAEVPEEDSESYDKFIDGLRNCLRTRRMTSEITDIVTYIHITIKHIISFLEIDVNFDLLGRIKSLESDLTKLIIKSCNSKNDSEKHSVKVRDRFGLRVIILNKPEEVAINYIYDISDAIVGILASKNRKIRKEFCDWVESSDSINPIDRIVINEVLNIPFDIDDLKDYIKKPKDNGYKSFHFTLAIQPYSNVIPGCSLEIQLRTEEMDQHAATGTAAHDQYKKYSSDSSTENPLTKIFVIDNFSGIKISRFSSYDSRELDRYGIHWSKAIANRTEDR